MPTTYSADMLAGMSNLPEALVKALLSLPVYQRKNDDETVDALLSLKTRLGDTLESSLIVSIVQECQMTNKTDSVEQMLLNLVADTRKSVERNMLIQASQQYQPQWGESVVGGQRQQPQTASSSTIAVDQYRQQQQQRHPPHEDFHRQHGGVQSISSSGYNVYTNTASNTAAAASGRPVYNANGYPIHAPPPPPLHQNPTAPPASASAAHQQPPCASVESTVYNQRFGTPHSSSDSEDSRNPPAATVQQERHQQQQQHHQPITVPAGNVLGEANNNKQSGGGNHPPTSDSAQLASTTSAPEEKKKKKSGGGWFGWLSGSKSDKASHADPPPHSADAEETRKAATYNASTSSSTLPTATAAAISSLPQTTPQSEVPLPSKAPTVEDTHTCPTPPTCATPRPYVSSEAAMMFGGSVIRSGGNGGAQHGGVVVQQQPGQPNMFGDIGALDSNVGGGDGGIGFPVSFGSANDDTTDEVQQTSSGINYGVPAVNFGNRHSFGTRISATSSSTGGGGSGGIEFGSARVQNAFGGSEERTHAVVASEPDFDAVFNAFLSKES